MGQEQFETNVDAEKAKTNDITKSAQREGLELTDREYSKFDKEKVLKDLEKQEAAIQKKNDDLYAQIKTNAKNQNGLDENEKLKAHSLTGENLELATYRTKLTNEARRIWRIRETIKNGEDPLDNKGSGRLVQKDGVWRIEPEESDQTQVAKSDPAVASDASPALIANAQKKEGKLVEDEKTESIVAPAVVPKPVSKSAPKPKPTPKADPHLVAKSQYNSIVRMMQAESHNVGEDQQTVKKGGLWEHFDNAEKNQKQNESNYRLSVIDAQIRKLEASANGDKEILQRVAALKKMHADLKNGRKLEGPTLWEGFKETYATTGEGIRLADDYAKGVAKGAFIGLKTMVDPRTYIALVGALNEGVKYSMEIAVTNKTMKDAGKEISGKIALVNEKLRDFMMTASPEEMAEGAGKIVGEILGPVAGGQAAMAFSKTKTFAALGARASEVSQAVRNTERAQKIISAASKTKDAVTATKGGRMATKTGEKLAKDWEITKQRHLARKLGKVNKGDVIHTKDGRAITITDVAKTPQGKKFIVEVRNAQGQLQEIDGGKNALLSAEEIFNSADDIASISKRVLQKEAKVAKELEKQHARMLKSAKKGDVISLKDGRTITVADIARTQHGKRFIVEVRNASGQVIEGAVSEVANAEGLATLVGDVSKINRVTKLGAIDEFAAAKILNYHPIDGKYLKMMARIKAAPGWENETVQLFKVNEKLTIAEGKKIRSGRQFTIVDTAGKRQRISIVGQKDTGEWVCLMEGPKGKKIPLAISREELVQKMNLTKKRPIPIVEKEVANSGSKTVERLWPEGLNNVIRQGKNGDCYFLSTLNSLKKNPKFAEELSQIIKETGPNQWRVRFYNREYPGGPLEEKFYTVTVDDINKMIKADKSIHEGAYGDLVLERAYARFMQDIRRNRPGETIKMGQDLAMEGGARSMETFEHFLGEKAAVGMKLVKDVDIRTFLVQHGDDPNFMFTASTPHPEDFSKMFQVMKEPELKRWLGAEQIKVFRATGKIPSEYLARDISGKTIKLHRSHNYSIGRVNKSNGTVEIINPHNTGSQRYILSIDEFKSKFNKLYHCEIRKEVTPALAA
ncbi:MAG: hypothetical protein WC873_04345 [Candidatus Gracilibacteria bacterium]